MKKSLFLILSIVLILSVFTGCTNEENGKNNESEDEVFTFAMSGLYKPFNYKDKDGNLVGFDVEIGKELAKRMGMEAEPVTNPWETILMGLTTGKYDAIIGSMAITEDREEKADFTRPYYRSGAQVFIASDNNVIKAVEDVKGKRIGVVKNSTFGDEARKLTEQVMEYDSDITALQDLGSGRIDAVITDQMVGYQVMNEGKLNIKDVGEPLWVDEMGIPVDEGNTELLNKLNKALEEMMEDGTYDKISQKWFGRNILGE